MLATGMAEWLAAGLAAALLKVGCVGLTPQNLMLQDVLHVQQTRLAAKTQSKDACLGPLSLPDTPICCLQAQGHAVSCAPSTVNCMQVLLTSKPYRHRLQL